MSRNAKKNNTPTHEDDDDEFDSGDVKQDFQRITEAEDKKIWRKYILTVRQFKGTIRKNDLIRDKLHVTPGVIQNIQHKYDLLSPYRLARGHKTKKKKSDNPSSSTEKEKGSKKSNGKSKKNKNVIDPSQSFAGGGPDDASDFVRDARTRKKKLKQNRILRNLLSRRNLLKSK